ncbi:MAG: substrate-binding domain-containing protein [Anaerolineae bacterium]
MGKKMDIFKYIVENSIDAILMTDPQFRVIYTNRACNEFLAYTATGKLLKDIWFEGELTLLHSITEQAKTGGFFSAARLEGFHSVVDHYPGIQIVGTMPADWDREKGIEAAEEFLKANPPGTLDVIWAASSEMALGAMLAVEAAGRQEVKVFSNDVTPESAERIREGRLMAETYHGFPEWGWYGTKFAVMLALGQDVPPIFDVQPRTVYKENADLFYPTPALEPTDWEGIKADRVKGKKKLPDKIVIGWAPPEMSGPSKIASDYFEKAAADAREHGINVEVITRVPSTHTAFAEQLAIIEGYIRQQVDAIVIAPIEVEVVKSAIKKANEARIPVIIVNLLEPIEGVEVASYIGFNNTVAGKISGYAVVDYLGGPGVLGEGEKVEVEPGTSLDLVWWQNIYKNVNPETVGVKGRVAIIEGISGNWRGETQLVRSDGSVVHTDVATFPIRDEMGQFAGLTAVIRDITERKRLEEERARLQREIIEAQRRTILELSTPIVPVLDKVLVLPLVGSIDTARAQQIMENLLQRISQYRIEVVIIDITGVPVVDTKVADHLIQVTRAARLLGARCILVGISPEVAHTIVSLGVDLSGLITGSDLQSGVEYALSQLGRKIIPPS